jgi:ADP-ribose pyrophosphatase
VAILPVDEDGAVYLTKQFRYAVGRPSIEAASGAIEDGESAEAAARRELREELGIEAGEWVDLGVIFSNTSIMKDQSHLFLAFDLTLTEPQREGSEKGMTTIRLGLDEAVSLIMRNEIFSSVACTLVLKAKEYLSRNENRG